MNNATRAFAIGLIFTALCITLAFILSGCNDHTIKEIRCNDGTSQRGTNIDPNFCDNHGGNA